MFAVRALSTFCVSTFHGFLRASKLLPAEGAGVYQKILSVASSPPS